MGLRFRKVTRIFFNFLAIFLLASLIELPSQCQTAPGSDKNWPWPGYDTNTFSNNDRVKEDKQGIFGNSHSNIITSSPEEDQHRKIAEMATKTIVGIIVFLVLASFIAFLVCLCCPICILAKMRQRRRGFVYQTAGTNGTATTVQTGGATVTVVNSMPNPRRANPTASPPASSLTNSPYPVQQSVNMMPPQPNQPYGPPVMNYPNQAPYPMNTTGMPMPMAGPHMPPPTDLPPPYPGLPRETETLNQQPAYNPYFSGSQDAPNPYMPTTAPYPTK
ncbi:unnamed protein product [Allacma fusca]|uniref:Uncharacterized protein n=1 Tax=Allacma fusca TaxID=39272 RepID=A0A8J2KZA8_9HEXA|nr:unnamed protein product [Allacma fusca]